MAPHGNSRHSARRALFGLPLLVAIAVLVLAWSSALQVRASESSSQSNTAASDLSDTETAQGQGAVAGGPSQPLEDPTAVATATTDANPDPTPGVTPPTQPVEAATPTPTATPVPAPTPTSTPLPTSTPTPEPTPTPTPEPTPTVTPAPTPTAEPTPAPQPVGQGGAWQLLFEDNFDIVDTNKWETGWFSSSDYSPSVNGNGGACFHPGQLSAAGGYIQMRIEPNSDSRCRLKAGDQADFVGALINTRQTFTFSYGYAEARMFLPGSDGRVHNWPAFWHTGFDWPATGEVDIAEGLSGGQICAVYHFLENGQHAQEKGCIDWPDQTGWHVFAADWEPGRITYYYDGVEVFQTTRGVVGSPHYLIFDYTVRADGSDTVVPSTMLVDYVRVWQRDN